MIYLNKIIARLLSASSLTWITCSTWVIVSRGTRAQSSLIKQTLCQNSYHWSSLVKGRAAISLI